MIKKIVYNYQYIAAHCCVSFLEIVCFLLMRLIIISNKSISQEKRHSNQIIIYCVANVIGTEKISLKNSYEYVKNIFIFLRWKS